MSGLTRARVIFAIMMSRGRTDCGYSWSRTLTLRTWKGHWAISASQPRRKSRRAAPRGGAMNKPVATPRTGFVLIAVLVIIGSAALVATALLFMAQTQATAAVGAEGVEQSRVLAWSGVQATMLRLDEQRERILSGQPAELDVEQLVIYETPRRLGVVRVLSMGGDNVRSLRSRRGSGLSAEAGKLDLNSISAEELAATGMIDRADAEAIVVHRQTLPGRAFQSVGDLLSVPGAN